MFTSLSSSFTNLLSLKRSVVLWKSGCSSACGLHAVYFNERRTVLHFFSVFLKILADENTATATTSSVDSDQTISLMLTTTHSTGYNVERYLWIWTLIRAVKSHEF